jgi:hypothetical protein
VRIWFAWLLALGLLLPHTLFAAPELKSAKEEEIKAAFLYNFTKFITWPTTVFTTPSSPFNNCLLLDHTKGTVSDAFRGKMVADRSVEVLSFDSMQDVGSCQILYIGDSDQETRASALAAVDGKPVLTIGENKGFAQQGGMINFYIDDDRVLFEINVDAVNQAGLSASSRLLSLARIVKESN